MLFYNKGRWEDAPVSESPRRSAGRTPSGDVRSALVDAAEAVLVREGPAAVTVRAVATEAGVAPMGVYNRFGGKDGLVEALMIRGFERLRQAVAVREDLDPLTMLRTSGGCYREFALANRELYAVMFGQVIPIAGEPSPELGDCAAGAFGELVHAVERGIEAGLLRPGDPRQIAHLLWSAIHGAVTLEIGGQLLVEDAQAHFEALQHLLRLGLVMPGAEVGDAPA